MVSEIVTDILVDVSKHRWAKNVARGRSFCDCQKDIKALLMRIEKKEKLRSVFGHFNYLCINSIHN